MEINRQFAQQVSTKAILLHRSKNSHEIDLTVHDVMTKANDDGSLNHMMGAGRVLGIEEKNEIACTLTESVSASMTLLDEHILVATPYALAWWIPAAVRTINFRLDQKVGGTTVVPITFEFPSQVALMCRGSLYFASIKAKKSRPKASTKLFNSPLPNLYDNGRYCTGNATSKIPRGASVKNVPAWEAFLFDTVNNRFGSQKPLLNVVNTEELVDVIEAEKGGFPTKRLVPMNLTLDEWITQIDGKNLRRG